MAETSSLTPKLLRKFGLIMGAVIAGLFGLVIPLWKGHGLGPWPWGLAGLFVGLGFSYPQALGPIYRFWMKLGHVLGWVNSRLILGLIFFLVVTPMAIVMKLLKRDTMVRQFEPQRPSYRQRSRVREPQHLQKPY
ncbi:SxtJ family membrane protein [Synechocystis sp. LKSZ1]|uniref:SxtJ family membrane protein n=1 Tax=Synechocystis sp. LKSZ1 TaxID=3144951 RepID=UPI00336BB026